MTMPNLVYSTAKKGIELEQMKEEMERRKKLRRQLEEKKKEEMKRSLENRAKLRRMSNNG